MDGRRVGGREGAAEKVSVVRSVAVVSRSVVGVDVRGRTGSAPVVRPPTAILPPLPSLLLRTLPTTDRPPPTTSLLPPPVSDVDPAPLGAQAVRHRRRRHPGLAPARRLVSTSSSRPSSARPSSSLTSLPSSGSPPALCAPLPGSARRSGSGRASRPRRTLPATAARASRASSGTTPRRQPAATRASRAWATCSGRYGSTTRRTARQGLRRPPCLHLRRRHPLPRQRTPRQRLPLVPRRRLLLRLRRCLRPRPHPPPRRRTHRRPLLLPRPLLRRLPRPSSS